MLGFHSGPAACRLRGRPSTSALSVILLAWVLIAAAPCPSIGSLDTEQSNRGRRLQEATEQVLDQLTLDEVASLLQDQQAQASGLPTDRIIGGEVVSPPEKYPYMASLVAGGYNSPYCGGSLIAPNVILTAGHCSTSALKTVWVGRFDWSDSSEEYAELEVEQTAVHPSFYFPYHADIMLIKTVQSAPAKYKPVALDGGQQGATLSAGVMTDGLHPLVTIMGWGWTEVYATAAGGIAGKVSTKLREVTFPGMSRDSCNAPSKYQGLVSSSMICAADDGKDSCNGDSGGPLIVSREVQQFYTDTAEWQYCEDVQVGLLSFGPRLCGSQRTNINGQLEGLPGVYTRVASYKSWIISKMADWGAAPRFATPCGPSSLAPPPSPAQLPCPGLPAHFVVMEPLPICASSVDIDGKCMSGGGYFLGKAQEACTAQGARLCTLEELQEGRAASAGCAVNATAICWTSTTCSAGHMAVPGGGSGAELCLPATTELGSNLCCGGGES